jgi:hypothetical protein
VPESFLGMLALIIPLLKKFNNQDAFRYDGRGRPLGGCIEEAMKNLIREGHKTLIKTHES